MWNTAMRPWWTLSLRVAQLNVEAAQVIALRTTGMAMSHVMPSEDADREMARMVPEKLEASGEAMLAMSNAAYGMAVSNFWAMMKPWDAKTTERQSRQIVRLAKKGLAPFERTVSSNLKRLKK